MCGLFLTPYLLKNKTFDGILVDGLNARILTFKNTEYVIIRNKRYRIVHIVHQLGSIVPLVVLIHGIGGQVAQWEYQLEYFSSTANVLAIDLLGCGRSDISKSETMVFICHSYGCCLGTFLYQRFKNTVKAMTFISVKADISDKELKQRKTIQSYPDVFFDVFRVLFDRRGGINSYSVNRMLHKDASVGLRTKQLKWNKQSKTFVWKRMLGGFKWITRDDIRMIQCPLLLIAGQECDMIHIHEWCTSPNTPDPVMIPHAGHNPMVENPDLVNLIINDFLIKASGLNTVDPAWQIVYKTKDENKWSMKNYQKWKQTPTIADRTVNSTLFRPMKVMRQVDEEHSPEIFIAQHPEIGFIIDITKDPPPYRTQDFDNSHIKYNKLSTASKIPPSREEVRMFIQIAKDAWSKKPDKQIAVHCHYGFNRTGFMICCYMIEELHISVSDAIHYFEEARRPRGIKHRHFKEELYLRYEPPPRINLNDSEI
ncbi:9065_t:CDS:10 [Cetraspora pellucida]|uniref:9065_t:CDS:1 n=1 Tax=Cetraspora pellucida TaxID=1433469 RepID=A0A9N9HN62_9GLOM|nr:9065_t:CDS:10 [Cetraspora pellucida]